MKKFLLIIFLSLLGFTSFAFTYKNGCLRHRVINGINTHVAVVTLNGTLGASMSLYYLGWYYGTEISSTSLGGGDWAYEFAIGGYVTDNKCHPGYEIIPTGDPYDATAEDLEFCHCSTQINDACISRRMVNGQSHQIATVVYGPDIQGVTQCLWYWDAVNSVMSGPYWPSSKTWSGSFWTYVYDLGVISGLYSSIQLYTAQDVANPPILESEYHFNMKGCQAKMLFACHEYVMVNGVNTLFITVAYDQGILGQDQYLFWWNGSNFTTGVLESKVMVNGIWKYTYNFGTAPLSPPDCYEVYSASAPTPQPTQGTDPYVMACECKCDPSFSYCINPADPYKILLDLNYNPLSKILITIDGSLEYFGPGLDTWIHDFSHPGSYNVCVKVVDENCDEYCLQVCVAEQGK